MIEVLSAGIASSIQDLGRFGLRHFGVPVSGAMDVASASLANALLNNDKNCAVLESTIIGPRLKFHQATFIAITGAKCRFMLNDKLIKMNCVVKVNKNDVLNCAKTETGMRNYLAVLGGFKTQKVLNSRSYYLGITDNMHLKKGDLLAISKGKTTILNRTSIKTKQTQANNKLQVAKGPEFELLNKKSQLKLFSSTFVIANQSNRMAYKLEHTTGIKAKEIITSAVQPGCVQLTPAGELIILMRDCQTTGGYSRVLQLSNEAINHLAQMPFAQKVKFTEISI